VGEDHDLQRMFGLQSCNIQGVKALDSCKTSENAIEAAAIRNRVDMGAEQNRSFTRSAMPSSDDVAARVDVNVQSGFAHHGDGQLTADAILFGKRQPRWR